MRRRGTHKNRSSLIPRQSLGSRENCFNDKFGPVQLLQRPNEISTTDYKKLHLVKSLTSSRCTRSSILAVEMKNPIYVIALKSLQLFSNVSSVYVFLYVRIFRVCYCCCCCCYVVAIVN